MPGRAPPTEITQLNHYPVKSMRGITTTAATVERTGLRFDRRWMVVSEARGRFLTQRGQPGLALLQPEVSGDGDLRIAAPDGDAVEIRAGVSAAETTVTIWNDVDVAAVDEGDEVAAWLTARLGKRCRLVRAAGSSSRTVREEYGGGAPLSFADGFPFLLTTTASLADLNARLERDSAAVPMNRFRPNIVVASSEPYEEDTWAEIRIGDIAFELVKPCPRCQIVNTDQTTGDRTPDVLDRLETYRADPSLGAPTFGWNLVHRGLGTLEVGMPVEVATRR